MAGRVGVGVRGGLGGVGPRGISLLPYWLVLSIFLILKSEVMITPNSPVVRKQKEQKCFAFMTTHC